MMYISMMEALKLPKVPSLNSLYENHFNLKKYISDLDSSLPL